MRKKMKIFIGIAIGIFLSGGMSYVIASTLINSKDVVYEDNSNLVADNVQDAIDGTCSKIDTRLSTIEDKLYTIKDMYKAGSFTSSTELAYTGVSITLAANSYCSIRLSVVYNKAVPLDLVLCNNSTKCDASTEIAHSYTPISSFYGHLELVSNFKIQGETTYYVWAKYSGVATNTYSVLGFCATKYK